MDSKPDFTAQLALAVAAVAASSAALFFGTGLHPLWWLAWIATLPVLLAATRLPRWTAFAGRPEIAIHECAGGHAFDNHFAPGMHSPDAAAQAWERTSAFLAANL